ncbi:MAG TPA: M20/M25/M40 family metallo-hydrolase [Pyrinomonadaceae bacterium]|jgi:hypothetical protein|nr:M20/M25/M40 family metallo-hydrolase [Pyrinomonadaceae bacterium]
MSRRRAASALLLCLLLLQNLTALGQQPTPTPPPPTPVRPAAQATPQPTPTTDPIERIKEEGLKRSQLMQTLSHITEVIGPRLTGSPGLKRANIWTRDKLSEWGLTNAHLEAWGPFGRGWTLRRFSAEVTEPLAFPLLAYPRAWSPGTKGALTGEVFYIEAKTEEELQKYKGRLKGAIVLTGAVRELRAKFDPVAQRLSEKELLELANAPDPATVARRPARQRTPEEIAAAKFEDRKTQFYYEEGVGLLASASVGGDGGMLQFVQSASVPQPFDTPFEKRIGPWRADAPAIIPQIGVSNDHFNRLVRMLRAGQRVRMNVNLAVEFHSDDLMSYNTVAEIAGSDLKDEVVMLGAHLDSWHLATGATDNAAGVAMMMEAVRILRALNLQPRRTIRIALWSGEEQGLLGSRAYVREHFGPVTGGDESTVVNAISGAAPSPTATPAAPPIYKTEYDKFNVYFNADSGTGKIRGIYLQGNEPLRPTFRRWLQPFRELGAETITVSNAGGSDFLSFDAIGLPGLDFLQDDLEYGTRTWHSNQDTLDRIQADDVKQAAVIIAAFVYNAAMSDQRLPRKPARTN